MPIQTTEKIWHNGNLIPWEQAKIHVMSHVIHYGSSVFEGVRCYGQPQGSAVFRLPEHMQRLLDSAKIYRMEIPFTLEELCAGVVDTIEANGVAPCYIRPIALRGYGEIGVNPEGFADGGVHCEFSVGQISLPGTAARMCASQAGTGWRRTRCRRWPKQARIT